MVKDPVCGMTIDENKVAGKTEYRGTIYYFCSSGCKKAFEENPERFIGAKDSKLNDPSRH
jgi:Cu+-exporting ATPase